VWKVRPLSARQLLHFALNVRYVFPRLRVVYSAALSLLATGFSLSHSVSPPRFFAAIFCASTALSANLLLREGQSFGLRF
jgi:hypothetical protein